MNSSIYTCKVLHNSLSNGNDPSFHHKAANHSLQKDVYNTYNRSEGKGFDDAFIRKWQYYLNYCEAAFAMRYINVMQMVYTLPNHTNR